MNHHPTLEVRAEPDRRRRLLLRLLITSVATLMVALLLAGPASAGISGRSTTRVEGTAVPWPAAPETCDPAATGPVDYVLAMPAGTGSLVGCIYGNRLSERLTPGGQLAAYSEETFVGCLGDLCGSFRLEALITNRWDGLPGIGDQINGRCQHKIVRGSGTGDFAGVEGRLDFKDIIVRNADGDLISLSFDYRGHLRFG